MAIMLQSALNFVQCQKVYYS